MDDPALQRPTEKIPIIDAMAMNAQGRPPLSQPCLLSPSEWRIVVAIHELQRAATFAEICTILPGTQQALPDSTVLAVLERLHRRGLVAYRPDRLLWGPLTSDFEDLLTAQVEHFLDIYILDRPQALLLLRELVDGRLSQTV
jgi:predicted transcriptional regulator